MNEKVYLKIPKSNSFTHFFSSKLKMMIKIFSLLFVFALSSTTSAAKKIEPSQIHYEIEGAETGVEGTFLIKVYVFTNKSDVSPEELKLAAVHGVIFRGFSRKGYSTQMPMAPPEIENQKADFFNAFWNNGDYLSYAEVVNPAAERIKISKKEYKIGAVISVSKDSLRKFLEKAGIIRGLNSGF